MPRGRLAVLAVLASVLLGGCVIPFGWGPGSRGTRENLGEDRPAFIVVSQTTREEVLLALGEPDGEAPDSRWLVYGSEWSGGGAGIAVLAGAPGGVGGAAVGTERVVFRRLLVWFDAQGTVTDSRFESETCRQTFGAGFVNERGGTSEPRPCLDIAGGDLRREAAVAAVAAPGESALPPLDGSWLRERPGKWTTDRRTFVPGTVLVTDTALVFLPPPGLHGRLPRPVRIDFADMADVSVADFRTITRITRRDGTRDSFLLPHAVRDLVVERARTPAR